MASVKQLGYLALNASDLTAWEKFATEVLGLAGCARRRCQLDFPADGRESSSLCLTQNGADDIAAIGWEVNNQQELADLADQLRGVRRRSHGRVAGRGSRAAGRRANQVQRS